MNLFKKFNAEVLPKFHPLFAGFTWAAAARSEDSDRLTLTHVLVEPDPDNDLITYIVATDGRRMHVHTYDAGMFDDDICDEMLTPGLYTVVAKTPKMIVIAHDEDGLEYPNWRQVTTDHEPQHTAAVNAQTVGIVSAKTGNLYAVDFLRQACGFGCGAKTETVHIAYGSEIPQTCMVVEHELGRAYLMPIKWDDEEAEDEKAATGSLPNLRVVEADDEEEDEPELI